MQMPVRGYSNKTNAMKTEKQFDEALNRCRNIFIKKMEDYGPSWRVMRSESITDQLFIKAKRIRTLQTGSTAMVNEGILPEFIAIVNYGIMGLIQLDLGTADHIDISRQEALEHYDRHAAETRTLMIAKNHDYGEAWRDMRLNSYADFILTKINRNKQIEENCGQTLVSEGVDANLMDIINYAIFGVIKLTNPGC